MVNVGAGRAFRCSCNGTTDLARGVAPGACWPSWRSLRCTGCESRRCCGRAPLPQFVDLPPSPATYRLRSVYPIATGRGTLIQFLREPHQGRDRALCCCANVATVGGRIMKMMTREQLFGAPKLVRRGKGRLERGIAAVSAARVRATEIARQTERPRLAPVNSQGRRRVERLSALVTLNH